MLQATAEELQAGVIVTGQLAGGELTEADGTGKLTAISTAFAGLSRRLSALGEPPEPALRAARLVGESLELFASAYDHQAQGAAAGDGALIDQGTAELNTGSALLGQISEALPDCAASPPRGSESQALATPEETALTVFFRLAESLLNATDSKYLGTAPEVLTESAQASCRVLLAGGDLRSAIEAAIAASPLAGQPFGSDEQQFVLLVVTRGAALWCPSVVADKDAFTSEVIATVVDVFFDG